MPRPQKHQSENTRARAIEAADALLHQHGYHGVSMDAIAKNIGIRKASLYHHFPEGKDQIMLEIAERLIEFDSLGFQNALETGNTVRQRLEAMAVFIFKDKRQTNRVLRETMRFMPLEHQHVLGSGFFGQIFAKAHQVFESGIANGELRSHDTRFSAFAFLSLLSEMNAPDHQKTWSDLPARISSILLSGLETKNQDTQPQVFTSASQAPQVLQPKGNL
jgi:AcrR family transcriptional regulator